MNVEVEFSICPSLLPDGKNEPGGDFFIFRQIDRYGTNFVKVLELPARNEIAAGNLQVAEFIARRVKFDFQEFQQSFYHDQYDTRRAQATQIAFFEAASGIRQMREAIDGIQREIEPMEREFSYYQKEIARNLAQIEKHARNAAKLPDLAARLDALQEPMDGASRRLGDSKRLLEDLRSEAALLEERAKRADKLLELSVEALSEEMEKLLCEDSAACQRRMALFQDEGARAALHSARTGLEKVRDFAREVADLRRGIEEERQLLRARSAEDSAEGPIPERRAREGAKTLLQRRARKQRAWAFGVLAAGLLLGLCSLLSFQNQLGSWGLSEELARALPWLLAGSCAALLASSLFLFLRSRSLKKEEERVVEANSKLTKEIEELEVGERSLEALLEIKSVREIPSLIAGARSYGDRHVAQKAQSLSQRYASLLDDGASAQGDARGLKGFVSALSKADRDLRARVLTQAPKLEKQMHDEGAVLKKLQGEKERVEVEIRECQSQASKKEALEEKNHELEPAALNIRAGIDLRLLAGRLLEETAASVRAKLGPTLTRFVKSVLPRLTSGRYRDVRVEEDLEIKVFSSDKNDFLSIHELSGGTNEALCLALRLAMSQAFVEARTRQAQFVFLDEPFKMMDFERAAETLKILPELSQDLRQFLVIQPDFSVEERKLFDVLIRTSREETELNAGLSAPIQKFA
jgi:uncharacterized protein YhaN